MRKLIGAIAVALAACGAAQAADKNGDYQTLGAGAFSCESYLSAGPNDRSYVQTWWAGYVTALNHDTDKVYSVVGMNAAARIDAALLAECTANKKELLAGAIQKVITQQLDKNKIVVSPN
jgi:hypothetical protein